MSSNKSDLILVYENGPASDFRYILEELYRSPNGNYLLKREGGPMTEYGERRGQDLYYGKRSRRLSEDEAKAWALRRGISAAECESVFSEPLPQKEKGG